MYRAADGKPALHQASGNALILIALLHGGLALYPQDSQSEADLVEIADQQMYRNKRARRMGRSDEYDARLEAYL